MALGDQLGLDVVPVFGREDALVFLPVIFAGMTAAAAVMARTYHRSLGGLLKSGL
jgi:hypothetical protein